MWNDWLDFRSIYNVKAKNERDEYKKKICRGKGSEEKKKVQVYYFCLKRKIRKNLNYFCNLY